MLVKDQGVVYCPNETSVSFRPDLVEQSPSSGAYLCLLRLENVCKRSCTFYGDGGGVNDVLTLELHDNKRQSKVEA